MKSFLVLAACVLAVSAYEPTKFFKTVVEPRIVNGAEASSTDFPYQVALFVSRDGRQGDKCGGALITNSIVLTAAHCFDNFGKQGYASFGSNRYLKGDIIPFNHVITHAGYIGTPQLVVNDIALVKLDIPVATNGVTIDIIKLNGDRLEGYTPVTASGFGLIGDNKNQDNLNYTPLTTITNDQCRRIFNVRDSVVCTLGQTGGSTCQGDSGGPLVVDWPNNPTHVGIVSFGGESCEKGFPMAFTRTSDFIDWILENVKLL